MLSRISRLSQSRAVVGRLVAMQRFSTQAVQTTEKPAENRSIEEHNRLVGADIAFNEQKHGYVLTFPWNFEQVISDFESSYRPLPTSAYWHKFMVNSRAIVDFNNLFREFHQACAIPDHEGIAKVCEPRLANYVSESIKRIHFHGLDVEMANLTVEQPSIRVLKAEVNQGVSINRDQNLDLKDYRVSKNHGIFGAKWTTYKSGREHVFDVLDVDENRPYLVSLTCLVESPMKLYVLNQNHSSVLFGSEDSEIVKNVVRFEANLRWFDFFNLLPVNNKKSVGEWKITDFNNVLNENPLFEK